MYIISNSQMEFILRLIDIVARLPDKSLRMNNTKRMAKNLAKKLKQKKSIEHKILKEYEK